MSATLPQIPQQMRRNMNEEREYHSPKDSIDTKLYPLLSGGHLFLLFGTALLSLYDQAQVRLLNCRCPSTAACPRAVCSPASEACPVGTDTGGRARTALKIWAVKNSDFLQNSDLSLLKISLEIHRVFGESKKGLWLTTGCSKKNDKNGCTLKVMVEGTFKGNTEHLLKTCILLREPEWWWLRKNKPLAVLETTRHFDIVNWHNFEHFV